MVKLVDKQNIFNSGILSTKLFSRDDLKQYNNGLADAMNFVCSRYGPIEKRTGTEHIWNLGNPGAQIFLLPFIFSVKQTILLEFLHQKIRFYTFGTDEQGNFSFGPITNNGSQYEITTNITGSMLSKLSFVQSLDVIYIAFSDGTHPPCTITRYANTDWRVEEFETEDGPYLDQNYSRTRTIQIADTNTNTSTAYIRGFSLSSVDVGRWIRICTPRYNENTYAYEDKWSYGKIASVGEYDQANKRRPITITWSYRNTVDEEDQSWMTKRTSEWRLGVWHSGSGNRKYPATYPTKVTIHQQRLVWAGMTDRPWVWTSNSFAYNNYAPSDYEGDISDTNAIYYDMSSDKISEIFWIKSLKHLLLGTETSEIRLYSAGTAITPSDVVSCVESSYGSYNSDPVINDDTIVFIQRLQRTIRSLSYDYNQDAFVGPELTILAEGLTVGGIKKVVFQKEPNNTYWCLKEDGSLLSLTYDKSQDVIGWSKSKLAGSDVKIIDLAVLPSDVYGQDVLLLCTERRIKQTVNGVQQTVVRRYLEMLSRNFNNDIAQKDVLYLDDAIRLTNTTPMEYITGLDYLEGETVRVMDEGAYVGDYKVTDGTIHLDSKCKDVWVGLPYSASFETLERDFQDKQLSTKMSKLRVYKLKMYIERSLGISVQRLERGSRTMLITFDPTQNMDAAPNLVTGIVDIPVPSNWDCDYRLQIISEPGFPCTVSGILMGVEINAI